MLLWRSPDARLLPILLADDADALVDVAAGLDFVYDGDGVVGVADDGLATLVERQLLAAEQVVTGAHDGGAGTRPSRGVCRGAAARGIFTRRAGSVA